MERGKLILIEGTDFSGKETQSKLLLERLNNEGFPSKMMSFPRYETPTGRIVGECYLGKGGKSWFEDATKLNPKIASLYYAADRLAAFSDMNAVLSSGINLILNRYIESNKAHQGGKLKKEERTKLFNFIDDLEHKLLGLPRTDISVLLYMPLSVSMQLKKGRPGEPDAHESSIEHLKNAEETYLQLANMYNWIKIDCAPNGTINSLRKREDIAEELYQKIIQHIKRK